MNLGKERKILNRDNLLEAVNPYDVYRYYLGFDFELRRMYLSPFRKDNRPSFGIFIGRSGTLMHKDFGTEYSGNCINFVSQLYNIDFYHSMLKIDSDLGLGFMSGRKYEEVTKHYVRPVIAEHASTLIQIVSRKFTIEDIRYWGDYGLSTDDLKNNDVFSVGTLYVNKKRVPTKDLVFAYLFKDGDNEYLKIYSPYSQDWKWISNVPVRKPLGVSGLEGKSNVVVVTKSKKDKMVLNKLITDVYEAQKEGTEVISDELDDYFNEHYDKKFCFFDNDEPGKRANKALNPKGYGWINVPNKYSLEGIKDPSDLVRGYGYEVLEKLLKSKKII